MENVKTLQSLPFFDRFWTFKKTALEIKQKQTKK